MTQLLLAEEIEGRYPLLIYYEGPDVWFIKNLLLMLGNDSYKVLRTNNSTRLLLQRSDGKRILCYCTRNHSPHVYLKRTSIFSTDQIYIEGNMEIKGQRINFQFSMRNKSSFYLRT